MGHTPVHDMPPYPPSSSPTAPFDLRIVVETPLRQFAPWLATVLLVTWFGYPGVVCVTPLAWLSVRRGLTVATRPCI